MTNRPDPHSLSMLHPEIRAEIERAYEMAEALELESGALRAQAEKALESADAMCALYAENALTEIMNVDSSTAREIVRRIRDGSIPFLHFG